MVRVAAVLPSSDQDAKLYVLLFLFCGDGALMVWVEPTITVRVNVAVEPLPSTVSDSPPGLVWKVSATVFGSRRRTFVSVRPPESVAVSFSSRYDGYSWSGAVKDPLAPTKLCSVCE